MADFLCSCVMPMTKLWKLASAGVAKVTAVCAIASNSAGPKSDRSEMGEGKKCERFVKADLLNGALLVNYDDHGIFFARLFSQSAEANNSPSLALGEISCIRSGALCRRSRHFDL